jgi:ASC-1-like (ASCH) protein
MVLMYTEILILYTMTLISMPLPPPPLLYKGYDNNKSTEYILNKHKRHLLNGEFIAASDNMSKASIKRLLKYDRFRKILRRSCELDEILIELQRRSIDPDDLGTHSFRKGAATYCSSGNTAGPSSS